MRSVVLACALIACAAPPRSEPLVGRGDPGGSSVAMPPQRLELVEGTPTTLPDGTVVNVKHVGYAHLMDSRNLSNATLVLARDGTMAEVALAREHGGPADKPMPGEGLGWRFVLELADPYQRPSRAIVEAQKL